VVWSFSAQPALKWVSSTSLTPAVFPYPQSNSGDPYAMHDGTCLSCQQPIVNMTSNQTKRRPKSAHMPGPAAVAGAASSQNADVDAANPSRPGHTHGTSNAKPKPGSALGSADPTDFSADADHSTSLYFAPTIPPVSVATDSYSIRTADAKHVPGSYNTRKVLPSVVLEHVEVGLDGVASAPPYHADEAHTAEAQRQQFTGVSYQGNLHVDRSPGSRALLEHWEATAIKMGMHNIDKELIGPGNNNNNAHEAHTALWSSVQRPVSGTAANAVNRKRRSIQPATSSMMTGSADNPFSAGANATAGAGFRMAMRNAVDTLIQEKLSSSFPRDVSIPTLRYVRGQ
jgi:hypothetical protein